ncbi:hypothetical protein CYLTODRAFT_478875 [Cylindrobasidium torrendii FP15055 ss-10]|uniref:Uncharacterized protein n=1 Tax=Cylindrobasidium torrendii FP15055 ss-10 TaxID=1314674 RepID=A0A0D7BH85_9AGAR|nr:hypothetical protein CYLTODRAFT_478875 [Cylindrobasidium torrendii FP15055 ss-10]
MMGSEVGYFHGRTRSLGAARRAMNPEAVVHIPGRNRSAQQIRIGKALCSLFPNCVAALLCAHPARIIRAGPPDTGERMNWHICVHWFQVHVAFAVHMSRRPPSEHSNVSRTMQSISASAASRELFRVTDDRMSDAANHKTIADESASKAALSISGAGILYATDGILVLLFSGSLASAGLQGAVVLVQIFPRPEQEYNCSAPGSWNRDFSASLCRAWATVLFYILNTNDGIKSNQVA